MEKQEIETKAVAILTEAQAMVVIDRESYDKANAFSATATSLLWEIDGFCDPNIKRWHEGHKQAIAEKNAMTAPIEQAKRLVDGKMTAWYRAEQAKAEAARKEAEEKARKEAEEKRLAEAEMLERLGMNDAADSALSEPIIVERVAAPIVEKADGVFYRDSYSAKVVDLMALVKAVAAGSQPLAYLEANMVALNSAARTQKDTMQIPGIVVEKTTTQGRR